MLSLILSQKASSDLIRQAVNTIKHVKKAEIYDKAFDETMTVIQGRD